jgi:hypothetical protein
LLTNFAAELKKDNLRAKVIALIPAFHTLRDLGSSLIPINEAEAGNEAQSGRERILAYLLRYPLKVIDGDELMVVSGIGDWARRVRELRIQFGWWIYSGYTFDEIAEEEGEEAIDMSSLGITSKIKPDQYILMRVQEDRDAAYRWRVLNEIRKKKVAVIKKLIEYFRKNVGRQITGEELKYLAGDKKEWARRARQLRTEYGWPVFTKLSGRADLPVGVYILEEDRQTYEHDRRIPDKVRVEVLERDQFKCVECRWNRAMMVPDDPRKMLELHHKRPHKDRGANTADNLITLCNVCHDTAHRHK